MHRKCVNEADNFCYICSKIAFASQKHSIKALVRKACILGAKLVIRAGVGPLTYAVKPVRQTFGNG